MQNKVLILDFGSQVTQLIARRVRELNIYCEIHPFNHLPENIENLKGVILSGSPCSVRENDAPDIDIDFAWDERDNILNRVLEEFHGHAAMVASHIPFQPRMAVRETAKVFGLPEAEIKKVKETLLKGGVFWEHTCAGEATRLAYGTDEAAEGRDSFLEKRPADWSDSPYHF